MGLLILPILSFLLGAAHFLHAGNLLLCLLSLLMPLALLVRHRTVVRVIQAILVLLAMEWVRTMLLLIREKQAWDLPWHRSAIILGGVASFTILSALAFEFPALKRRYA